MSMIPNDRPRLKPVAGPTPPPRRKFTDDQIDEALAPHLQPHPQSSLDGLEFFSTVIDADAADAEGVADGE